MEFSVKWAALSAAYAGMIWGAGMAWHLGSASPFGQSRLFGMGVGLLFGGAALPFVASNLLAALLATWLARGQSFSTQFGVYAILGLILGSIVLFLLDKVLKLKGGLHFDLPTLALTLGLANATLALALLLMKIAPGADPGSASGHYPLLVGDHR